MTVNMPLVNKVLDMIEGDVERWDQSDFISECGTFMCFGGWSLIASGYQTKTMGVGWPFTWFVSPEGLELRNAISIETAAAELLGFDEDQTYHVFHWQPEDNMPTDMNYEVYASKAEQFAAYKKHVLETLKEDDPK